MIELTATDLGTPGRDDYYGWGRIDAYNALRTLYVPEFYPTIETALNSVVHNDEVIVVTSGTPPISIASYVTIPPGVTLRLQQGVSVNFNAGLSVLGRVEMQPGSTITSSYITITGSNGTFSTNGTSNARNTINITNYGTLEVGGFLSGEYTDFNFGTGSSCRIASTLGRIYMDPYNHKQWNVSVSGSNYPYNTYNSVFRGNGTKGSWNGFIVENQNGSYALENLHIRDAVVGIQYVNSRNSIKNNSIVNCTHAMEFYSNSIVNIITGNIFYANGGNEDVYVSNNSVPNFGTSNSYGNNSFKNNTPQTSQYPIWSLNSSQLTYAEGNFFRIVPLPPNHCPNVVISTTIPDPAPYFKIGGNDNTSIEMTSLYKSVINSASGEKDPVFDEMNEAYKLYLADKNEEAEIAYRNIISKYPNNKCSEIALVFLEIIAERSERDAMSLLDEITTANRGTKISEFAEYRKVYQYINLERYEEAAHKAKESTIEKVDDSFAPYKLYDLGMLYWYYMDNKEEGRIYFEEFLNQYPDHGFAYKVRSYINDYFISPPKDEEDKNIIALTETKLFANYPNPFNPSTVIKYQIGVASQVSLKVYDIMGREVTTLVNSFQDKGSYDVTFNANGLSSGIYFYKLSANGQQLINKMLLMK